MPEEDVSEEAAGPPASEGLNVVVCALIGIVISILCFLVPLLHFVLGPLGPLIGGAVAGNRSRPGLGRVAAIALIMAIALAIPAAAFTGLVGDHEADSMLARLAPFIVFAYTGFFGFVGGVIGMMTASSRRSGAA